MLILAITLAALLAASFAVTHEWGFNRLRWRDVTPDNCIRYLLARGWRDAGGDESRRFLDKDTFRIIVACTAVDPATAGAIRSAIEDCINDGRVFVVVTPGGIEPGVEDEMLSRQVVVLPYTKLDRLEGVLLSHEIALAEHRAYEKRMLTEALDLPIPAKLLPVTVNPASPAPEADAAPSIPASPLVDVLVGETEHVQCFFRDKGADRLLISFNDSWRSGPGGRLQPGIDLAALGYSIVDFVTREPNWFPAEDMASLIPLLMTRLAGRFPRRITFGFSQGGYGAIKYSRVLGATSTIAFSPQFTIDPRLLPKNRFTSEFRSHLNLGMHINAQDCTCPAFVVYDPYDYDDPAHIPPIMERIAISVVKLPFAGHGTSRLFATPDRLERVLAACETGNTDGLRSLGTQLRKDNPDRPVLMAYHLASKWPNTALDIADMYRDSFGPNQTSGLCYRLATAGHSAPALAIMERLASDHQDDDEIQGCAALVALEARRALPAQRFIERARELRPESAKWAYVESQVREMHFQAHD